MLHTNISICNTTKIVSIKGKIKSRDELYFDQNRPPYNGHWVRHSVKPSAHSRFLSLRHAIVGFSSCRTQQIFIVDRYKA